MVMQNPGHLTCTEVALLGIIHEREISLAAALCAPEITRLLDKGLVVAFKGVLRATPQGLSALDQAKKRDER
jgi:hypothetical protein